MSQRLQIILGHIRSYIIHYTSTAELHAAVVIFLARHVQHVPIWASTCLPDIASYVSFLTRSQDHGSCWYCCSLQLLSDVAILLVYLSAVLKNYRSWVDCSSNTFPARRSFLFFSAGVSVSRAVSPLLYVPAKAVDRSQVPPLHTTWYSILVGNSCSTPTKSARASTETFVLASVSRPVSRPEYLLLS